VRDGVAGGSPPAWDERKGKGEESAQNSSSGGFCVSLSPPPSCVCSPRGFLITFFWTIGGAATGFRITFFGTASEGAPPADSPPEGCVIGGAPRSGAAGPP